MPDKNCPHLLVTGADGHLGRRVVELLRNSGARHVTAVSHQLDKIFDLAARGARIGRIDFNDPASLSVAFAGVDRLLHVSAGGLFTPTQCQRQTKAVVDAAVSANVKHLVYFSLMNPKFDPSSPVAQDYLAAEQSIEDGGIPFTILRVNWYAEYLLLRVPTALRFGKWLTSAGDGRTAYVSRDDVARAGAAALSAQTMHSRWFDITGPRALTSSELVQLVNGIFGSNIALIPASDEELAASLAAHGMTETSVTLVVAKEQNARAGWSSPVSNAVEQLTGKVPRDLSQFLVKHRLDLLLASSNRK